MSFRFVSIVFAYGVCLATIAGVLVQGRQLGDLRAEHQRLVAQQQATQEIPVQPTPGKNPQPAPSLELLRLRAEISRLTNRRRELNSVTGENEKLLVEVAVNRTNSVKVSSIPPGYIRKSTARNAGYNTPEDTLETFLWALQNRDLTTVTQVFTPEAGGMFQKQIDKSARTGEDFFKGSEKFPPLRVANREQLPDGSIELQVEFGDGTDTQKMRFQQINGQWKMEMNRRN